MPDDKIEWLNVQECREAQIEFRIKHLCDQFFEYHANSHEKYARLIMEYELTSIISDKIIAFKIKIVKNESLSYFIFEVVIEYSRTLNDRDLTIQCRLS